MSDHWFEPQPQYEQEPLSFHWDSKFGYLICLNCHAEWPCHFSVWGLSPEEAAAFCPSCKEDQLHWYSEQRAKEIRVSEPESKLVFPISDIPVPDLVDRLHTWNYRVVEDVDEFYMIEAHYNIDGELIAWATAGEPLGNDLDDLIAELKLRLKVAEESLNNPEEIIFFKELRD